MKCPNCNHDLQSDAKFCNNCGFAMKGSFCPQCKNPVNAGATFCPRCGTRLSSDESAQETISTVALPPQKNKTPKKKHTGRRILMIFACVIIVGAAGLALYCYTDYMGTPTQDFYQDFTMDEISYDQENVYVDSQILVTASADVKPYLIKRLARKYGGEIIGYIGVSNDYQISFPEGKTSDELQTILEEFNSNASVELATLNYLFDGDSSAVDYSNDPWQAQTEYENSDESEDAVDWNVLSPDGNNWWAEVISVPLVWNLDFNTDLATVNVGILDSMFDATNTDLTDCFVSLSQNPDNVDTLYTETYSLYEASTDESEKAQLYNKLQNIIHGTHVSGIISAEANSFGITGISQNADLYGFSVFDEDNYEYISMMEWKYGVAELLNNDVKIINMSMCCGQEISISAQYDESQGLTEETSVALSQLKRLSDTASLFLSRCLEQYDFLIVKAAGNENGYSWVLNSTANTENPYSLRLKEDSDNPSAVISVEYDSNYDFLSSISDENVRKHIITVGSVTLQTGDSTYCEESYFSAGNAEIYAPGMQILSDFPRNFTDYLSGTSMSASMVTGISAIIWGINPNLTAVEVKNILLQSTQYNTWGKDVEIADAFGSVAISLETLEEEGADEDDKTSVSTTSQALITGYAYLSSLDTAEDEIIAVPNAVVTLTQNGQENTAAKITAESDGTFVALLPEGDYLVTFTADGYNSVEISATVETGTINYLTSPMTLTATSAVWDTNQEYNEDTGSDLTNAFITGYNDKNERCWVVEVVQYEQQGDFDPYVSLGMNADCFYSFEDGTVKCINIADGSLKWETSTNLTNVMGYVFGDDGTLYAGGMYCSPSFIAVNNSGEVLVELDLNSDTSYMPHDMEYEEGIVYIPMSSWYNEEDIYIEVDTSDYSVSVIPYPEFGHTAEGEAYRTFMSEDNYPQDFYQSETTEFSVYDINNDGVQELILREGLITGCYYVYGYVNTEVTLLGTCEYSNRQGAYYSAASNAFVIISNGGADFLTYEFYQANNKLNLMFKISHSHFGPGLGTVTEDNPQGYEIYSFSYYDADGVESDIKEADWNAYIDDFEEITFTEFEAAVSEAVVSEAVVSEAVVSDDITVTENTTVTFEEKIEDIRTVYYSIQDNLNIFEYSTDENGIGYYRQSGILRKVVIPAGTYDSATYTGANVYSAECYYDESGSLKFVFAFNGTEEYRYYIIYQNGSYLIIRYIDSLGETYDYADGIAFSEFTSINSYFCELATQFK